VSSTLCKRSAALLAALTLLSSAACKGEERRSSLPTTTTSSTTTSTTTTSTTAPPPPVSASTKVVTTATGVVAPVLGLNADGTVAVRTPCENVANLRRVTDAGPIDVLIDPGHGGNESGAVGANGLAERTVNLAVSKHVIAALDAAGVRALLTRTGDYRVTLTQRANIAHAANPRALVSVHHNGDSDGPRNGPGTEVFYQHASADSRRLAGLIYEEVVAALSQYQGVPWQADRDAGAKPRLNSSGGDYYAMLRQPAPVTSVLAELLFMSNPPEAELVARPDVQLTEGNAVARGVVRYLTTNDPGSGYVEPYPRTQPAGGGGGLAGCTDPPLE
jgi:N-acetylmuramoyl-L-alanine amidase